MLKNHDFSDFRWLHKLFPTGYDHNSKNPSGYYIDLKLCQLWASYDTYFATDRQNFHTPPFIAGSGVSPFICWNRRKLNSPKMASNRHKTTAIILSHHPLFIQIRQIFDNIQASKNEVFWHQFQHFSKYFLEVRRNFLLKMRNFRIRILMNFQNFWTFEFILPMSDFPNISLTCPTLIASILTRNSKLMS